MMNIPYFSVLKRVLFFTLALAVGAGLGPLLVAQSAQFLGKDVSQVAAGILGFYPIAAVEEVTRILVAVSLVYFALGWPWAVASHLIKKGIWRLVCFPAIPLIVYSLSLVGTILKYPSFFSPFLSRSINRAIYQGAFIFSPKTFWVGSGILYLGWIAVFIIKRSAWIARRSSPSKMWFCALIGVLVPFLMFAWNFTRGSHFPDKSASGDPSRFPNVLLIAVDSLRVDRLGRESIVPALRGLLADSQAVEFNDHYVGVPRTFPSWVELVSGAPAPQTGIRHMFPGFGARSKEFSGFITELRDAGYDTQVWSDFAGDIFPRFFAGFQHIHTPNMTLKTMIRLSVDQSVPLFLPILMSPPFRAYFPSLKQSPAFADSSHLTSDVIDGLDGSGRPWLKVVFYSAAHFPYAAPHPFYTRFTKPNYRGPFFFEKNPELGVAADAVSDEDKAQIRSLYDGSVNAVDTELGRLFDSLRKKNLWDSTLIVVTADHGEDLYEHDRLQGHGEHLRGENVLKVPLIVKLPRNLVPYHREISDTTRSIDLSATILEICGIKKMIGYGRSLLSQMMDHGVEEAPRPAYSETGIWFSRTGEGFFQNQRLDYPGISRLLSFDQGYSGEIVLDPRFEKIVVAAKHRSLVFHDYKIIYVPTSKGVKYELYNRKNDPDNLVDLSSVDPVRLADMRFRLLETIKKIEGNVILLDDFVVPQ